MALSTIGCAVAKAPPPEVAATERPASPLPTVSPALSASNPSPPHTEPAVPTLTSQDPLVVDYLESISFHLRRLTSAELRQIRLDAQATELAYKHGLPTKAEALLSQNQERLRALPRAYPLEGGGGGLQRDSAAGPTINLVEAETALVRALLRLDAGDRAGAQRLLRAALQVRRYPIEGRLAREARQMRSDAAAHL